MVKYINGNILKSGADTICHQVNCQGVMGAGLAKQIREKYPIVFLKYKDFCNRTDKSALLGLVQFCPVGNPLRQRRVANLFSQKYYGRDDKCYTDYNALRSCLQKVNTMCVNERVAIPYKMGCGLAGGDWNIVEQIIRETLVDCEVEIYKL